MNNCSFTGLGAGTAIKFSGSASTNTFNNVTVSGFTTVLSLSAGAFVINTGGNIRGYQVVTTPYNFIDETGQSWLQVTNGVPSIIPPNGYFISDTNGAKKFISTNNALLQF